MCLLDVGIHIDAGKSLYLILSMQCSIESQEGLDTKPIGSHWEAEQWVYVCSEVREGM